ncbi:MAG: aromatic ring-hydroxylating dioxygenase subunit alpha [Candidatus Melainabacteria bacterium]|nr:aromatic ring-hydroxylating dioxygenase subunit alpha [Candidatus Melainabacteria bacterium]
MKVPSGWYAVLSAAELKPNKPLGQKRFGEDLVFWRDQSGRPAVLKDLCPHRSVKLSGGEVCQNGNHIACPFHGFQFDSQGQCRHVPETGKEAPNLRVKTWQSAEKNGFIWLYVPKNEDDIGSEDSIPWFNELQEKKFCYSEFKESWNIHYSRCIENQLDYAHLPYLHRTSIGKNFDVQGKYDFLLDESSIKVVLKSGYFHFKFPNIWYLNISPTLKQMLAFVPVDDNTTVMYVRAYQAFVTLPLLEKLVGKVLAASNRVILNQDKAAVITHSPSSSLLASEEKLYPSDRGIAWFRKQFSEKAVEV